MANSSVTLISQVKLRDALVSSLQFSRARDAELAWVDGQLHMDQSQSHLGLLPEGEESKEKVKKEGEEKMETDQDIENAIDTVPVLEQLSSSKVRKIRFLVSFIPIGI